MGRPRLSDDEKRRRGTFQPVRSEQNARRTALGAPPKGEPTPEPPEGLGGAGKALWAEIWHHCETSGQFMVARVCRMADDTETARAAFSAKPTGASGKAVADLERRLEVAMRELTPAQESSGRPAPNSAHPKLDALRARYEKHRQDSHAH